MNISPDNSFAENRAIWVEALRSNRYEHGKEYLHRILTSGRSKFCCLGVACDLLDPSGWLDSRSMREYAHLKGTEDEIPLPSPTTVSDRHQSFYYVVNENDISESEHYPPYSVFEMMGVKDPMEFVQILAVANDNRESFGDIARFIEGGPGSVLHDASDYNPSEYRWEDLFKE